MSGIVGSKFNHRGSGLVGSLGTDGQHMLSSGAGKKNVFETVAAAAYDDEPIKSDLTALAIREATNESSAAFNLPSSFIETFTDDTNLGTQTTCDRLSGYMHTKPVTTVTTTPAVVGDWNGNTGSFTYTSGGLVVDTGDDAIYSDWVTGTGDFTVTVVPDAFHNGGGACCLGVFDIAEVGDYNINTNTGGMISMTKSWLIRCKQGPPYAYDELWLYYGSSLDTAVGDGGVGTSSYTDGPTAVWKLKRRNGVFSMTQNISGGGETTLFTWNATGSESCYLSFGDNGSAEGELSSITLDADTAAWSATGTLIQSANTVTGERTEVGGTMLYKDNEGTATLGTDLIIYFTCDGGSNWTEAAGYNAITPVYSSGVKQVRLDKTTCTGGTDVRYKAVWANQADGSKETQLHGIGINY